MIYLIVVTLLIIFGIGVLIFSYRPEQPRPSEPPTDMSGLYRSRQLRERWEQATEAHLAAPDNASIEELEQLAYEERKAMKEYIEFTRRR